MDTFKNAKLKITYTVALRSIVKGLVHCVQGAEICQNRCVLIDSLGYAPSYRGPPIAFRGAGYLRPRGIFRSSKWVDGLMM